MQDGLPMIYLLAQRSPFNPHEQPVRDELDRCRARRSLEMLPSCRSTSWNAPGPSTCVSTCPVSPRTATGPHSRLPEPGQETRRAGPRNGQTGCGAPLEPSGPPRPRTTPPPRAGIPTKAISPSASRRRIASANPRCEWPCHAQRSQPLAIEPSPSGPCGHLFVERRVDALVADHADGLASAADGHHAPFGQFIGGEDLEPAHTVGTIGHRPDLLCVRVSGQNSDTLSRDFGRPKTVPRARAESVIP